MVVYMFLYLLYVVKVGVIENLIFLDWWLFRNFIFILYCILVLVLKDIKVFNEYLLLLFEYNKLLLELYM